MATYKHMSKRTKRMELVWRERTRRAVSTAAIMAMLANIDGLQQPRPVAQLHAREQMHHVGIACGGVISALVAQTSKKMRYSAHADEQGHRLAVAFAMVQVAPAVPHAIDRELHLLVAIRPFGGKSVL